MSCYYPPNWKNNSIKQLHEEIKQILAYEPPRYMTNFGSNLWKTHTPVVINVNFDAIGKNTAYDFKTIKVENFFKPRKCSCKTQTLMACGCQCGGV